MILRTALVSLILAMTACAPAASPHPTASPRTAASDFGPYDLTLVEALVQDKGLTYDEALIMALVKAEVTQIGDGAYRMDATLPTGGRASLTVDLTTIAYTPVPGDQGVRVGGGPRIYGLTFTADETDGAVTYDLEYYVPLEDLYPEDRALFRSGTASVKHQGLLRAFFPVVYAQERGGGQGWGKIVERGRELGQDVGVDKLQEYAGKEMINRGWSRSGEWVKNSGPDASLSAGQGIWEAIQLNGEAAPWIEDLNRLEQCAQDPSNPLTKKMYQEDPSSRERTLRHVREARREVRGHIVAMFLGQMAAVFSQYGGARDISAFSVLMGWVADPTKETLKELAREQVRNARKEVGGCGPVERGTPEPEPTVADLEGNIVRKETYHSEIACTNTRDGMSITVRHKTSVVVITGVARKNMSSYGGSMVFNGTLTTEAQETTEGCGYPPQKGTGSGSGPATIVLVFNRADLVEIKVLGNNLNDYTFTHSGGSGTTPLPSLDVEPMKDPKNPGTMGGTYTTHEEETGIFHSKKDVVYTWDLRNYGP